MTPDELQQWAEGQVQVLIGCGVDPIQAQRTMDGVLRRLPLGADPRTWIDTRTGDAEITPEDVQAARVDWYMKAPRKYKRLLDAKPDYGKN